MSVLLPRKMHRRAVLRGALGGAAVSVGLPFLDCVLNDGGTALAATGQTLPVRFGTWYWGMGHTPGHAIAERTTTAKGIGFLEETKALKPLEDYLNFFGGFATPLDGHSNYTHFTGWVATRTGTSPARNAEIPAPTLDVLVSDTIGKGTRFENISVTSSGMPKANYSARGTDSRGNAQVVTAMVPLANMFGYINTLRSMSQGRAQYSMTFDHYETVPQAIADTLKPK